MKIKDGIPYRLLPGLMRRTGFINPSSYRLWMAPDHLLFLTINHYSETSKRFYFRDIQALVISNNNKGRNSSIAIGIITIIFGIISLTFLKSEIPELATVTLVCGSMTLIGLVINFIYGKTCTVRLHTAVQVEELPSLRFLRTTIKVVGMLKPMIEAAQGRLTPEEIDAYSPESVEIQLSTHANPVGIVPPKTGYTGPITHENGKIHMALFWALLVKAISSSIGVFYQHSFKYSMDWILVIAILVLAAIALRNQRNSDLPETLKAITWVGLGSTIVFLLIGLFYSIMLKWQYHGGRYYSGESVPDTAFYEEPGFVILTTLAAAVYAITAIMGVLRLNKFQSDYQASKTVNEGS